jgi:hypothetical protein
MKNNSTKPSKKYLIRPAEAVSFVTGRTAAEEQVVLGVPGPYVAGVFFNAEGQLLRHDLRHPALQHSPPLAHPGKVRGALLVHLWDMLDEWKAELRLIPNPIRVWQFSVPELGIWIADLPQYLQDYSDTRDSEIDEAVRSELDNQLVEWQQLNKFVLRCGNEYWMNSKGEVTDT